MPRPEDLEGAHDNGWFTDPRPPLAPAKWNGGRQCAMANECPSCGQAAGQRCRVTAGPLKGQPYPETHVTRWMLHWNNWWCDACHEAGKPCHRSRKPISLDGR